MDVSSFNHQSARYAPFHPSNNHHLHHDHHPAHRAPSYVSYNRGMDVPPNSQPHEQFRDRHHQPARPPPQIPSFGRAPVFPPPPCYRPYESHFTFLNPIRDDHVYNNPSDVQNCLRFHENSQIRSWDHSRVPVDNHLSDINFDRKAFSLRSFHYPPPSRSFHESNTKSGEDIKNFEDRNREKGTKVFKDANGNSRFTSNSYESCLPFHNYTFNDDNMNWNRSVCISKDQLNKDYIHDSSREPYDIARARQTLPKWDNLNAEICGASEPKSFSAKRFPQNNVNDKDGAVYTPKKRSLERCIPERVKRPFPTTRHVHYEDRTLKDSSNVPAECNGSRAKECHRMDLDVRFRSNVRVANSVVDHLCPIPVTDMSTNFTDTNTTKITKDSSYSSVLDSSMLKRSPLKSNMRGNIQDSMNRLDSAQSACSRRCLDNSLGSLGSDRESGEIFSSSDQDQDEINDASLDDGMSVPFSHAVSSPFTKYSKHNIACFNTESADNVSDEILRVEDGDMDKISHVFPLEHVGNVSSLSSQEHQSSKGFRGAEDDNRSWDTCLDNCINNETLAKKGTFFESSKNSFPEDDNRSFNIPASVEEKTPMMSFNVPVTVSYRHAEVHGNSCSVLQKKCDKCCINIVHDTENILCSDCIILSRDSNSIGESVSPGMRRLSDDEENVQTSDVGEILPSKLNADISDHPDHRIIAYSHYQAEGICAEPEPNSEEPLTQNLSDDTLSTRETHNNELYCNSKTSYDHINIMSIPTIRLQNAEIVMSHQNAPEHKEVSCEAKSVKRIMNVHSGNLPIKKSKVAYRYSRGLKGLPTASIPVSKYRGPPKGAKKSHTWHRTSKSYALPVEKKHSLTALEPNRNGKMQNTSYIRKGNSLVRKPSSISVNSRSSRVLRPSTEQFNSSKMEEMENQRESNCIDDPSNCMTAVETPPTSQIHELLSGQQHSSSTIPTDTSPIFLQISRSNNCSSTPINTTEHVETNNEPTLDHEINRSSVAETHISENKMETQTILDDQSIVADTDKISYVKRKSNQLVAALNPRSVLVRKADKTQVLFSDGYYKRSKHQLVRTAMQNHIKQGDLSQHDGSTSDSQIIPRIFRSASFNRRLSSKVKKRKEGKFSLVWKLGGSQPLKRESRSLLLANMLPHLFPWKRATYRRRFMHRSTSSVRPMSVARILDSSKKTSTIYTRSARGLSLRKAKVMGINGSNLKWSKSMDRKSKSANQDANLELVEVERRKKRRKVASPATCRYIRLCSGNKLIRDSKKRARILASEKVRWSLHTARNRLVRKRKYCQFYTRFGKCNKDEGGCPYIHDPSKVAVCTKYLNGLCYKPNCNLTHQIIPERMQDCTYFLQGMCSNEECPYRHVNVSQSAPVCDDFLKGYCADGDECRKKHRYVCLDFEVSGSCSQGTNCKLLHPNRQSEAKKRKQSSWTEQEDDRGRYFSGRSEIPESTTTVNQNCSAGGDDIFFRDGKFVDFVALNLSDDDDEDLQIMESDDGAGL